jgi:hypothetical protein
MVGLIFIGVVLGLLAVRRLNSAPQSGATTSPSRPSSTAPPPRTAAEKIVAGAKAQATEGAIYTPGYFTLSYPNGDLPPDKGVCTDVVVRALRKAGCDLQQLVHEDMKRNFRKYPNPWGLKKPDPNIDHRRVPNLMRFFERRGSSLTMEVSSKTLPSWQPGDVVCWRLDSGLLHCGVLSDTRNADGAPLVIHNLGRCVEEDCLTAWKIIGHFRYPHAIRQSQRR